MDPGFLYLSIATGAFGSAYFIYGKKQGSAAPMISGAALCIYPYFIDNLIFATIIGVALILTPWFFRS